MQRILQSIQKRGLQGTMMLILSRYQFMYKFSQHDLLGKINPADLTGPEEAKMHASRYEATHPIYFRKLFANTDWPFHESVFVDLGCGKGASLLYASEMNFRKVIGVELCEKLSEIAQRNLQRHSKGFLKRPDYEVINQDASRYEIPPDADCFYLFNPFDAVILEKVMQNIIRSVSQKKRKILILYLNAVHDHVIGRYPVRKIKYMPPAELDVYFPGGACVYIYSPEETGDVRSLTAGRSILKSE